MNGRFLLDTNIIISLLSGESKVRNHVADASEIFVPCIAIGELFFGAYKSARVQENHARIREFALHNIVLACSAHTAQIYGEIKNRLREKGQPIPENDVWIAAIAQQYALTLVTKDLHFEYVDNLDLQAW